MVVVVMCFLFEYKWYMVLEFILGKKDFELWMICIVDWRYEDLIYCRMESIIVGLLVFVFEL